LQGFSERNGLGTNVEQCYLLIGPQVLRGARIARVGTQA